jgi:hypothetical protein
MAQRTLPTSTGAAAALRRWLDISSARTNGALLD